MKALMISLYIFGACSFAASAQTKTADATMETGSGYSKYMEIEPLTLTPSKKTKKLELQRSKRRIDPENGTEQKQEHLALNKRRSKESKERVEGKLATDEITAAGAEE